MTHAHISLVKSAPSVQFVRVQKCNLVCQDKRGLQRIIPRAKIEEINTDDTVGVDSLLDRDYKYVAISLFIFLSKPRHGCRRRSLSPALAHTHCRIIELNESAFVEEESSIDTVVHEEQDSSSANQPKASKIRKQTNTQTQTENSNSNNNTPKRSKQAIQAGLDLFSQGQYSAAVEMFQLALELPGSGVMRLSGSPKEYACPSEGEEQSALYNMACAYCKLGQVRAALTCLEGLVVDAGFEDADTIRNDPDLVMCQGAELEALLKKRGQGGKAGLLGGLFGGGGEGAVKDGEKPWILW